MTKIDVLDLIAKHTREVLPELHQYQFNASDRLVDLGANSVDRAEIAMMVQNQRTLYGFVRVLVEAGLSLT